MRVPTAPEVRKALAAYVIPPVVIIGAALLPDSDAGGAISPQEWIAAAIACLSCGTVVYAVPNARKRTGAE